jgi:prepilin-type N-terminal cleavage/methylation domain-containing protein
MMPIRAFFFMKMFNKTGFSLPELMIVVAIVGIVSAIAAPNYMDYMAGRRLKGAAWMVMSDLMAARAKAVSQNITVTVTFTSNYGYTVTGEAAARDIRNDYYDVTLGASANPISFTPRGTAGSANVIVTLTSVRTGALKCVMTESTGRVKIDVCP